MSAQFEADICPETGAPRVRFNFDNGWSVSLALLMPSQNRCQFQLASVAACPTGHWGEGQTLLGPTEAFADEVVDWLRQIQGLPTRDGES